MEVWAPHFPFLYNFKNTVTFSDACHYGYINWSPAQAQQQSFLGLFQSSTAERLQRQT